MDRRRFYDCLSKYYDIVGLFDNYYKRMAVRDLKMPEGGRFLDAGCGGGFLLGYLKMHCPDCEVFGVDFSLSMVRRAKGMKPGHVSAGDCFCLPFRTGSIDVLFSSFVVDIFSIEEQKRIIGEFGRVLDDEGVLVLVNNTCGSGVFYLLSGFYVILSRCFPNLLLNRPIDSCTVVGKAGGFRLKERRILGFTEIAVFRKGS
ncbi:MAG: methyltransferase domain-containing protein [archaeon]